MSERFEPRYAQVVLDSLQAALMLLTPEAAVLAMNKAGRVLVEKNGEIAVQEGRLRLSSESAMAWLEKGLSTDGPSRLFRLETRSKSVWYLRLASPDSDRSGSKLLCLHESPCVRPENLIDLYGLSAAEARLASALASGSTVKEAAASRGTTVETVRSHLKSIFSKMHVNRQPDLVRRICTDMAGMVLISNEADPGD